MFCPLFLECPLFGISPIGRFHCTMEKRGFRQKPVYPVSSSTRLPCSKIKQCEKLSKQDIMKKIDWT